MRYLHLLKSVFCIGGTIRSALLYKAIHGGYSGPDLSDAECVAASLIRTSDYFYGDTEREIQVTCVFAYEGNRMHASLEAEGLGVTVKQTSDGKTVLTGTIKHIAQVLSLYPFCQWAKEDLS